MKKIILTILAFIALGSATCLAGNVQSPKDLAIICQDGPQYVSDMRFLMFKKGSMMRAFSETIITLSDGSRFGNPVKHYTWCDLRTIRPIK